MSRFIICSKLLPDSKPQRYIFSKWVQFNVARCYIGRVKHGSISSYYNSCIKMKPLVFYVAKAK